MNYEKKLEELMDQIKILRTEIADLKNEVKASASKPIIIYNPPAYEPYRPYQPWPTPWWSASAGANFVDSIQARVINSDSNKVDKWDNSISNQSFMR